MKPQPHLVQTPHIHAATITVQLLRPFSVAIDGVAMPAHAWRLRHPRQLFQMLCLRSGHRLHRDEAIEALWPDANVQASTNRLYHTIHVLRTEFTKMGLDEREPVLLFQAGMLCLNPHHRFTIDALHFTAIVQACRDAGEAVTDAQLEQAAALCESSSENQHDLWLEPHRKEAGDHVVWVLEQLAARHRAQGRDADATQVLQRLVALEPSNEVAHRALMELFDAAGQNERGLLQYAACKRHLARDLGAAPSPATDALRDAIVARVHRRQQAAALPEAEAPTPTHAAGEAAVRVLLGRETELAELQSWLADERCRLITIAAPAGTGKTSLALALAHSVRDRYRDGFVLVRLTALDDPAGLEPCICRAVGIADVSGGPRQALVNHLAGLRMLLVLDRFEHLVDAADLLSALIDAAPGLQILVTSQCVLNCEPERVFGLRQLADSSPAAAHALFMQIAGEARATANELPDVDAVALLCKRLGGNALTIELAAAQLAVLTIDQLAQAIDQPLALPLDHAAQREPQHRNLRAAIGWSVSLLDDSARSVLKCLTVFQGEFGSADAQAVLEAPFGAEKARMALRMLIERHLVCRDMAGPAGGSPVGYLLLDSIRQWLLEQADDSAQWAAVQASHAGLFRRRTAEAMALFRAGQVPESMVIYAPAERDIEAGIAWERSHGDVAPWLQWRYEAGVLQMTSGSVFEAIEHLRDAVRRPVQGDEQRRHSAWCWFGLSRALEWVGDVPGSVFAVRQARQRSIGCGDDRLEGKIGHTLAMLRSAQLHLRAARMHIESVLHRGERAGLTSKTCQNLCAYGEILALQGKYPEALAVAESAFDAALASNNAALAWTVQHWQAGLSLQHGLIERARAHVAEYTVSECLGLGRLPRFGMRGLEFLLDFECEQYTSAPSRLAQWRAVATGAHARLAVMVDLAAEFVMMEEDRDGNFRSMLSVDDSTFPFDDYVADFYVQLHCYRLRLQDQRGDWREALVSLFCALRPIRRCENPLWVSWLAEALAIVAARRGEHADAERFLQQSEQLQREAGILPTPRQVTSWRRVRGLAGPSPMTLRVAGAESAPAVSVRDTIDRLERWALATLDDPAPASRPNERARAGARR